MDHGLWDRRRLAASLGALSAGACAARPMVLVNLAQAQPPPPPTADAGQMGAGADLVGRVTVPVLVNGEGPFNFVVDTGANRTVISVELAASLALPSQGQAQVHGIAGIENASTALVARLDVGPVALRQLRVPTLPRGRLGADGLLGVDALKDRRVTLDFQRGELQIGPTRAEPRVGPEGPSGFDLRRRASGALPAPDEARRVVVPARYRFGQLIIIAADVAGRPVTAFLDSGSQSTVGNLALRGSVMAANPDPRARRYQVPLLSATGQTAQGEFAALPPLRIGGMRLRGLNVVFADLHVFDIWDLQDRPTILIGIDVMRSFEAIELDFGHRQVIFHLPAGRAS